MSQQKAIAETNGQPCGNAESPLANSVANFRAGEGGSLLVSKIRKFENALRAELRRGEIGLALDEVIAATQLYFMLEENRLRPASRRKYRTQRFAHKRVLSDLARQRRSIGDRSGDLSTRELTHALDTLLVHLVQD